MSLRETFNDYFKHSDHYVLTFEGPRGSGKTKQAKLFTNWLSSKVNQPVVYLQSPFRVTEFGKRLYNEITSEEKSDEEYAILGLLNKEALQSYILNHPKTIFVLDRWNLSFWVYQIQITEVLKNKPFCIWALTYPDKIQPNWQFLLNAPYEVLKQRSIKDKEPLHRYEKVQFVEKATEAYNQYFNTVVDENSQIIDTSIANVEETQKLIQDIFIRQFEENK